MQTISRAAVAALLVSCTGEEAPAPEHAYVEQAASNYQDGRWPRAAAPSSTIYFYIDEDGSEAEDTQLNCGSADNVPLHPADPQNILDAIAQYEAQTPLDFVQLVGPISHTGTPVLVFTGWNEDYGYGTPPAVTGSAGNWQSCLYLPTATEFGVAGTEHEIGHVLGLLHEHTRQNRDNFVTRDTTCSDPNLVGYSNKVAASEYTAYAPYDVDSIMHYASSALYDDTITGCTGCTGEASCDHPLFVRNTPVNGSTWIPYPADLSQQDINAIHFWYETPLVTSADVGGALGYAMTSGDFDGDGYRDLAVGAPYASTDVVPLDFTSGKVFLYKGTETGLTAWKTLTEVDFVGLGAQPHNNDRFGASLDAFDIDDDGDDDLVVGAPGYYTGGMNAGAVFLYDGRHSVGSRTGPEASAVYFESSTGLGSTSTSQFGGAVAMGKLDGTHAFLAIGAPLKTVGTLTGVGTVYVLRTDNGTWQRINESALTPAKAGDRFGSALKVMTFDDDSTPDLVVGAPASGTTNPGQVALFSGGATLSAFDLITDPSGEANGQFGAALAAGTLLGNSWKELVIGAPNKASGRGTVYVYPQKATAPGFDKPNRITLTGTNFATPPVAGDHFGTALAAGDLTETGGLAIGAPGVDVDSAIDAGAVFLFKGGTGTVTAWVRKTEHTDTFGTASSDAYGSALTIGKFADVNLDMASVNDIFADLAVGAPGRDAPSQNAGAIEVYLSNGTTAAYEETYGPATARFGVLP